MSTGRIMLHRRIASAVPRKNLNTDSDTDIGQKLGKYALQKKVSKCDWLTFSFVALSSNWTISITRDSAIAMGITA